MLNILYEDNHIIVVVKEPGIPSQADKTRDDDMLTIIKAYLKEKYNKPGNVYLGLVHRLDRSVGGVMVFAKTSKAASRLSEQIRNHTFKKEYMAVLCGKTPKKDILVDKLLKNPKTNRGNAGFTDEERSKIEELLNSGFTDSFRKMYPDKEGAYTWWSYMFNARANNAGWRIDYFLVSDRISKNIKDAYIYSEIMGSDHCPVGLEIEE